MGPKVGLWWGDNLFWGWKIHRIGRPNVWGERTPLPRTGTPNSSRIPEASLLSLGLLLLPRPLALGDLCCYISLSSALPPLTLVSHPCPYLSARPIGHTFWRSVSCCGPYRIVQGSHPHQWGQGVSCGYLIRRWQLLLGERTPLPRTGTLNSSRIPGASPLSLGLFLLPRPPALGDLCCYISLSSVYPPPTLVSHPCPYLSARPIGHTFWCSVSYCGPYRTVQGSHPHQWGQGVSCGYLIWRWQLLLELLFYHAPMASP